MNKTLPQIFVFAANDVVGFDHIQEGIAWRVIKNIGRGSCSSFQYEDFFQIRAAWNNGTSYTDTIDAKIGKHYSVIKNKTGIVLKANGDSINKDEIELTNDVEVNEGILAQLLNNGNVMIGKKRVGYSQSAFFKPSKKIYWGMASDVQEGKGLKSAVLNSSKFFELNLNGVSNVLVSLNGNAEKGYYFEVESKN